MVAKGDIKKAFRFSDWRGSVSVSGWL